MRVLKSVSNYEVLTDIKKRGKSDRGLKVKKFK